MKFSKLQAAGNDFILANGIEYENMNLSEVAKKVCDRHFGIGADGFMTCEKSLIADIKMNYYNSDGSRGEMCGNGIRCFSKFVYDNKIVTKDKFSVETDAGIKYIELSLNENGNIEYISVDMGSVDFSSVAVPCTLNEKEVCESEIEVDGKKIRITAVLMGVPHTVIFVDDYEKYDVNRLGKAIEYHQVFPRKTNVNFIKVLDDKNILIKTWERGAGRTLGCGTGCCSSAAVAYKLGKVKENKIKMITEGGEVFVEIGQDYSIRMKGKADTICNGDFFK